MEALHSVEAVAVPLLRANIDTDQIIPTRFLARASEAGLGEGLFAEWSADPDFLLLHAPWNAAGILLAGPQFGCGSSREAAPRALRQRGFRAVIAPSFGDIFFNNCFRNGIAPVRLPQPVVEALGAQMLARAGDGSCRLRVDLADCSVSLPATGEQHRFELPPRLYRMLHEGLDEIALTRAQGADITAFRARDRALRPWAYLGG